MTTPTTARKSCRACGHETSRPVDACPNCGDVYQTTTTAAQHTPGPDDTPAPVAFGPWETVGTARRYGVTVYFEHGKVAEVTSAHQEWTDSLRRIIDSQPVLLAALEQIVASRDATDAKLSDYAKAHAVARGESPMWADARAAIRQVKGGN